MSLSAKAKIHRKVKHNSKSYKIRYDARKARSATRLKISHESTGLILKLVALCMIA